MSDSGRRRHRKVVEGPWLTPEDNRLLRLASEGLTQREIAESLGVSISTVRRKLNSVFNKVVDGPSIPDLDP
jgi:DNA-binding CsgD family transcriptional regulator